MVKNEECSGKRWKIGRKTGRKLNARKVAKKGLTVKGGGAIIINVVARTANASELRETTTPILENDTEKKKVI